MNITESQNTCKACGSTGHGNYCHHCGQLFKINRISLKGLIQDIFHFITFTERGFGYTLKKLITSPGKMQQAYINGNRIKHQTPFAMFFLSVTIASLVRYWISNALITYHQADVISEANFFHQYFVIMYIVLLPVYSLITYLFFYKSGSNYAEIGVMMLYTLSFVFLMGTVISLLILLYPDLDTAYVEFPFFTLYFTITFINFSMLLPAVTLSLKRYSF